MKVPRADHAMLRARRLVQVRGFRAPIDAEENSRAAMRSAASLMKAARFSGVSYCLGDRENSTLLRLFVSNPGETRMSDIKLSRASAEPINSTSEMATSLAARVCR